MTQTLKGNIKLVTVLPLTVHNGDSNTPLNGDAIDMQASGGFENALVLAQVGAVGANISALTLKIQESDSSTFASGNTDAEGGAAVSVLAGALTQSFQIKRTKRYIRAVLTVTESGAADDVEIAATAVLSNWAKPFPTV